MRHHLLRGEPQHSAGPEHDPEEAVVAEGVDAVVVVLQHLQQQV